ncbi:MAG TPA: zf-HC2 domain-containing protein [Polyangia bacterium]|nr:zf-HC2 domain-containing protein [Polyangia bacterium]
MKSLKQTEVVCRDVVEVVNDYLEDAMAPPERAAFEQHLHACPWCLTYLNQIRETRAEVGRLAETDLPQLPAAVEASLRAAFRRRRRPE